MQNFAFSVKFVFDFTFRLFVFSTPLFFLYFRDLSVLSIFIFLLHWLQLFPLSGSNLRVDPDSVSFLSRLFELAPRKVTKIWMSFPALGKLLHEFILSCSSTTRQRDSRRVDVLNPGSVRKPWIPEYSNSIVQI